MEFLFRQDLEQHFLTAESEVAVDVMSEFYASLLLPAQLCCMAYRHQPVCRFSLICYSLYTKFKSEFDEQRKNVDLDSIRMPSFTATLYTV